MQSSSMIGSHLSFSVLAVGKNFANPGAVIFVSAIKIGSSILVGVSKREKIVSAIALIAIFAFCLF